MKKTILSLLLTFSTILAYSQTPDFRLVGFAEGTTGGAGGAEVTVSNFADLRTYAESTSPYIIYVSGTISNGADGGSIKVKSNKSIIGVGTTGFLFGVGLNINGVSNVIIQNLRFSMTGVTTRVNKTGVYSSTGDEGRPQILTNGGDCISIQSNSSKIWVDHCEFFSENIKTQTNIDLYDGLLDIKNTSQNITISWNYFHDHHKVSLIGSSDTDITDRKVTFHHNYYENVGSRLPLYRGGTSHIFNNYYLNASSAINSRMGACIYVEKNHFENVSQNVESSDRNGFVTLVDNIFSKTPSVNSCTSFTPSYNYSQVLYEVNEVKDIVKAWAGVGKLDPNIPILSATGNLNQQVPAGNEITNIVFTWGGGATGVLVANLPQGLTETINSQTKTCTISGIPATAGSFSVSTIGGSPVATINASISISSSNAKKIAYITDPSSAFYANDTKILPMLRADEALIVDEINATLSAYDVSGYDAIIISEVPTSSAPLIATMKGMNKPMLLMKVFAYKNTVWNWSNSATDNSSATNIIVNDATHPVFKNMSLTNGNSVQILSSISGNKGLNGITNFISASGGTIQNLATVSGTTDLISILEIPTGTLMNGTNVSEKFIQIGINSNSYANITESGLKIIKNACYYMLGINTETSVNETTKNKIEIIQSKEFIQIQSENSFDLSLYNLSGQNIRHIHGNSISVSNLNKGVYILHIRQGNNMCKTIKFVK